ncbi:MAG TPA: hypothetical protein VNO70_25940 [Blastocatellia bacterium]|nr:hypothetical protein [Blastocatellia bacterium]
MDEIGREVARAAGLSDDEVKAASSRIHYAGIRARILAEKDRGAQSGDGWLLMMLAVRRAIPAMAVIAALAAGVLWFAGVGAPGVNSFHEAISGSRGTCALPARDECLMTTDEVLAAIVSQEQEGQR